MSDQHIDEYFQQVKTIVDQIDKQQIAALVHALVELRTGGGRLFLLGVGGSAGNASHAVNDFRKLCALEAYAPTDNVSELSARINDEGWDGALAAWLKVSRLSSKDALLIFSVGGGNLAKKVSVNLIQAIDLARERQAKVFGVVGRDGGHYLSGFRPDFEGCAKSHRILAGQARFRCHRHMGRATRIRDPEARWCAGHDCSRQAGRVHRPVLEATRRFVECLFLG